jgi:hypothetical protein
MVLDLDRSGKLQEYRQQHNQAGLIQPADTDMRCQQHVSTCGLLRGAWLWITSAKGTE